MLLIWIALGWSALGYIAFREKWYSGHSLLVFFLLLIPAALIGPLPGAIALICVPTDRSNSN